MANPTPAAIVNKITVKNGLYNGHKSLVEAFLSVLPHSVKNEANDRNIELLFNDVKRNMFAKNTACLNTDANTSGTEHWALAS